MLRRIASLGSAVLVTLATGACSGGRHADVTVQPERGATASRAEPARSGIVTEPATSTVKATDLMRPDAEGVSPPRAPVRVTEPGCCPLPFWSADAGSVLFWFHPQDGEPGVYGVPWRGGTIARVADVPAGVHLGGRFTTARDGDQIALRRAADGQEWRLDTGGHNLVVSADGTEVAWVESLGDSVPGADPPPRLHWRAGLDGGSPARVDVPAEYALSDWTASGGWLLARVRRDRADLPALVRFDPGSGRQEPLLDGDRLRTFRISPGRTWLAVTRVFEADAADNGLYIVSTDGASPPRRLDLAGAYQWRDDDRLLVVPMEPGAPGMSVWQVEASSGGATRLVDPERTRVRIAAGEWSTSPGGERIVYRSADDDALWVLTLPPIGP